jgi:hypothetical protein
MFGMPFSHWVTIPFYQQHDNLLVGHLSVSPLMKRVRLKTVFPFRIAKIAYRTH